MIMLYQCFIQIPLTTCLTTIWCFLLYPRCREPKSERAFFPLWHWTGGVLYCTWPQRTWGTCTPWFQASPTSLESLQSRLIVMFKCRQCRWFHHNNKIFSHIYQLRLQRTSSCSKIPAVPPLSGELFALHHLFDIIHPSFFREIMAESHIFIVILTFFMFLSQVWFPLWQSAQASLQCIFPWISANRWFANYKLIMVEQIKGFSLEEKSNHKTKVLIFPGPLIAKSCPTCSTWVRNVFDWNHVFSLFLT